MATYKKPCIQCGQMIEGDSRVCVFCESRNPFGYRCPSCLKEIQKGQAVCGGCGRRLKVICPSCGVETFAGERCDKCGASLMIKCSNPRCGEPQFFENINCTACGKPIKKK